MQRKIELVASSNTFERMLLITRIYKEASDRNYQTILHPPDRKKIHGYAFSKCYFLHHRQRKDAGRLTGGKP